MNENEDIKIRNLTKLYTLVLLKANKVISGYSILKRLDKDLGKTSSPTYIYDFLNDLEAKSYIENVKSLKSNKSKGYSLTTLGNDFVEKILTRFDNLIEVGIQSKLKICASCGVKLYMDFHTEEIKGEKMNFCCKHCAKAYKNIQKP